VSRDYLIGEDTPPAADADAGEAGGWGQKAIDFGL